MDADRDKLKKYFGGQAVNRYDRVCAIFNRYVKLYGNPDNRLLELGCAAIISEKYMNMFLKTMPKSIHKRTSPMSR
jgi:hypothetical protein